MENIINRAFEEARKAMEQDEVPIGAVVFDPARGNRIIAAAHNAVYSGNDATAHAEIAAIRLACLTMESARLDGLALYVTLEPCAMCAGAIAHSGLSRLYYGAYDPKAGAVDHGVRFFNQKSCLCSIDVYSGMGEKEAASLLKDYFRKKREKI